DELRAHLVEEVGRAAAVDRVDLGGRESQPADGERATVRGEELLHRVLVRGVEAAAADTAGRYHLVGHVEVGGAGDDLHHGGCVGEVRADQRAGPGHGDRADGK